MKPFLILIALICMIGPGICQDAGSPLIPKGDGVYLDPVTGDLIIRTGEMTSSGDTAAPSDPESLTGHRPNPASRPVKPYGTPVEGREYMGVDSGDRWIELGNGESINPETGERILNLGDGQYINVDTGERIETLGDGERMNIDTRERIIKLD